MKYLQKFNYHPGGENDNTAAGSDEDQKDITSQDPDKKELNKDHKSVMQKIKDALHDWSNKDERDQEFDDTRV